MIRKYLSLILLSVVLMVPAIHKVQGAIPPDWFVGKFSESFIGRIPGGILLSYCFIIFLEFVGPLFLLSALYLMMRKKDYKRILSLGFMACYTLFLILTFGSFLVEDYDNGFKDFMYFVGILLIDHVLFRTESNNDI